MIQWPTKFLNVSLENITTRNQSANESEVDQAPLQHHMELLVIIIKGRKS